jgi:MarR family 2-MHQ and catechol resistance regulon transcriptional repressor
VPNRHRGSEEERRVLDTYVKLSRALASIDASVHRPLSDDALTASRFGVLEALLHHGPLNQRDLGRKILKSGGNISVVVDHLERDALVQRRRHDVDRRHVHVELTEAGRTCIERVYPEHVARLLRAFAPLSSHELTTLGALAKRLGLPQEKSL